MFIAGKGVKKGKQLEPSYFPAKVHFWQQRQIISVHFGF